MLPRILFFLEAFNHFLLEPSYPPSTESIATLLPSGFLSSHVAFFCIFALVDRKIVSCKIMQDSYKKVQFLQDSWMQWHSYKILARFLQETVLYHKKEILARLLQDSCKNLWSITSILQDLARNKSSVYTLCSDNLCTSPKTKHNQPLQVKFDELYNCWTHFVIEHL